MRYNYKASDWTQNKLLMKQLSKNESKLKPGINPINNIQMYKIQSNPIKLTKTIKTTENKMERTYRNDLLIPTSQISDWTDKNPANPKLSWQRSERGDARLSPAGPREMTRTSRVQIPRQKWFIPQGYRRISQWFLYPPVEWKTIYPDWNNTIT